MYKAKIWLAGMTSLFMSAGCGHESGQSSSSAPKGGLAVIDLDLFSKSVGRMQEMDQQLQTRKGVLDQAIVKVQNSFNEQLTAKKKEFGETPSEEQSRQLAAMQQEAQIKLNNASRQIQVDLDKLRTQLVANLRAEVRPFASSVAATKGLGVVIPKNEGLLLSFDPGVDITKDVITAYSASKKAAPAPQEAPPATMETAQNEGSSKVR